MARKCVDDLRVKDIRGLLRKTSAYDCSWLLYSDTWKVILVTLEVTFVPLASCCCKESVIMVIEVNKEVNNEVYNVQQVHTPVSFMK